MNAVIEQVVRKSYLGETKRARGVMTRRTAGRQGRAAKRPADAAAVVARRRQHQHPSTSSYRGVSWSKRHGKWSAEICHEGRHHYLGSFVDEADAARAYDARARQLHVHGRQHALNFPRVGERGRDHREVMRCLDAMIK